MRLMLDTNVILDVFMRREPFFDDSYAVLAQAADEENECFFSTTAVTDIYYLLRRSLKQEEQARSYLWQLLQLVTLLDVTAADIQNALSSEAPDFEDAVVCAIAKRHKMDCIVTRNTKDFIGSSVPAIAPIDFLKAVD